MAKYHFFTNGKYKGEQLRCVVLKDSKYLRWYALSTPIIEQSFLDELLELVEKQNGVATKIAIIHERTLLFKNGYSKWDWEANEKTNEKTEYTKQKFESFGEQVGEIRHSSKSKSASPGIQKSALDALALKWFRESAKKWHPDLCKGSSEPMKAVNDCYERLKELILKL